MAEERKKQRDAEKKAKKEKTEDNSNSPENEDANKQLDKLMSSPTSIDMVTNNQETTQAKSKGKVVGRIWPLNRMGKIDK